MPELLLHPGQRADAEDLLRLCKGSTTANAALNGLFPSGGTGSPASRSSSSGGEDQGRDRIFNLFLRVYVVKF
jgi:hypothetical protein